jgi:hypothetical protein
MPHGAFGTPIIALLDVARLLTTVVALLLIGAMCRGWAGAPLSRRLRRAGVGLVLVTIVGSRIERIGEPVTWQLVAGAIGVALIGWAEVRRMRGDEDPHSGGGSRARHSA